MDMRTYPNLKFYSNRIILNFSNRPINYNNLKKISTLYWKCLTTMTGFLFKVSHFLWYDISSTSSSEISTRLSLNIIDISSFHRRSAHDNVKKNVGAPNCFTIAKTWYKFSFQYAWVPLIELIKLKALPLAINFKIFTQYPCS